LLFVSTRIRQTQHLLVSRAFFTALILPDSPPNVKLYLPENAVNQRSKGLPGASLCQRTDRDSEAPA
jgi:hypothetical protein